MTYVCYREQSLCAWGIKQANNLVKYMLYVNVFVISFNYNMVFGLSASVHQTSCSLQKVTNKYHPCICWRNGSDHYIDISDSSECFQR